MIKELIDAIRSVIKIKIDECKLEEDAFWEMDRLSSNASRRRFVLLEITKECIVLVCFFDNGENKCAWLKIRDSWILIDTVHNGHVGTMVSGDFKKNLDEAFATLSFDKVLKDG